jgi:hypothetical protein
VERQEERRRTSGEESQAEDGTRRQTPEQTLNDFRFQASGFMLSTQKR